MTKYAACKFSTGARIYDYEVPDDLEVAPGMRVVVDGSRGEQTVTVEEVKSETNVKPEFLRKIVRIVEDKKPESETQDNMDF